MKKVFENKFFIKKKNKDNFIDFLFYILPFQIPKYILEGFDEINEKIKKSNLEKKPSVIVTSYDHFYDESFKFYVAYNVDQNKTKFVVAQHGSVGIDLFSVNDENEICDRYLSFGPYLKGDNFYPLFLSTVANKKKIIKKNSAKGLLICMFDFTFFPNKISNFPIGINQINSYVDNVVDLLKNLPNEIIKYSKIKFRNNVKNSYVLERLTYLLKINKIKIDIYDDTTKKIYEESSDYKFVIETINSTGFLEELNLNIPVILLTNKKFFHIKKEYNDDYKYLIKNKIIHLNAQKCSKFIIKNYDNIDKWWLNNKFQKIRKKFCNKYCRHSNTPVNDILKSLNFKK